MDVYPRKDYYNQFTALKDIDIRMPYYNSLIKKEYDWGTMDIKRWYLWKSPSMDYVYKLRNMLRILHEAGVRTSHTGVGYPFDVSSIEGTNYYGTSDIENQTGYSILLTLMKLLCVQDATCGHHFSTQNIKNVL